MLQTLVLLYPFWATAKALTWSRGHYSVHSLLWLTSGALVFFVLALASGHKNGWIGGLTDGAKSRANTGGVFFWKRFPSLSRFAQPLSDSAWGALLAALTSWQSYRMLRHPYILYAEPTSRALHAINWTLWVVTIASAAAAVRFILHMRRGIQPAATKSTDLTQTFAVSAVGLLLFARILTPFASPHPGIDVFTIDVSAIENLLRGINPYTLTYADIYGGFYKYPPKLSYPPGFLYLIAPWTALFHEPRWASVLAELASAWGIAVLARSRGFHRSIANWFAAVWLAFPVGLFLVEHAWVDVLLVPFFIWGAVALQRKRWAAAGILLGYSVMVKQYAAAALFFATVAVFRQVGFQAAFRLVRAALLTCLVVALPWLFWNAQALFDSNIQLFLSMPPREDALSWVAHSLHEKGVVLSATWTTGAFVAAFLGALALVLRRAGNVAANSTAATAFFLWLGFLFAKQAFCNYYYLTAALVWTWLVVTEASDVAVSSSA